jgi:protein tyrosine/serine phosphatase
MEVKILDWRSTAPSIHELTALLDFLNEKNGVLLHCNAGRDRTGYVIALYRMLRQRWTLERSRREMEALGHSRSRRSETSRLLRQWLAQMPHPVELALDPE